MFYLLVILLNEMPYENIYKSTRKKL